MKQDFDLAAVLGAQLKNVSDLDTNREKIAYIDIDQIDEDPHNFYTLTGLEPLASNIQLCGLQQPLRVRQGEDQRVTIVSGHRRRAALQLLVAEGMEQFRAVPCIRERDEASPTLRELRLIYANADTRVLSSPEVSRQVERVEKLLYALKEEGYEFPGRMRDHVAEACKLSKTKLANLKVIRERLIPAFQGHYEAQTLSESAALTLARLPVAHQEKIYDTEKNRKHADVTRTSEWRARECGEHLAKLEDFVCKKDKQPCANFNGKWNKLTAGQYSYTPCATTCCENCSQLSSCKNACDKQASKIKVLKEDAKAQRQQESQARAARERPDIEQITALWERFAEARTSSGKSVEAFCKAMEGCDPSQSRGDSFLQREMGENIAVDTSLPYSYHFPLSYATRLCKAADFLGCSVDFLLCRTEEPNGAVPIPEEFQHLRNEDERKGGA